METCMFIKLPKKNIFNIEGSDNRNDTWREEFVMFWLLQEDHLGL